MRKRHWWTGFVLEFEQRLQPRGLEFKQRHRSIRDVEDNFVTAFTANLKGIPEIKEAESRSQRSKGKKLISHSYFTISHSYFTTTQSRFTHNLQQITCFIKFGL